VPSPLKFHIDDRVRCELHFFTGLGFSGVRETVRVFVGGRKQGKDPDGSRVKSMGIVAPIGTRLVICASDADEGWENQPWRAVVLRKGNVFRSKSGGDAVQIPDLDQVDRWDAVRPDPDSMMGLQMANALSEGSDWTFGRQDFSRPLKCNVRQIRLDLIS
jgi:hypothetical protein